MQSEIAVPKFQEINVRYEENPLEYYTKYKESLLLLKKETQEYIDRMMYTCLSYEYILQTEEMNDSSQVQQRQNVEFLLLELQAQSEKTSHELFMEIRKHTEILHELQVRREIVRALRVRNYS